MAFPDGDGIRSFMGLLMQDLSTTNPGLGNTLRDDLFNERYFIWKSHSQPRVSHLTGATTGWASVVGSKVLKGTQSNHTAILRVFRETADTLTGIGPQMERMTVPQILARQVSDSTQGEPTRYALERDTSNARKWFLYLHPIASAIRYFSAHVIVEPTAMAGGSSVPDLEVAEVYSLCRVAAADGARLLGRSPEFIEGIWRTVPENFQAVFRRNLQAAWKPRQGLPS